MSETPQLGSSARAIAKDRGVVHFGYRPALDGLRTVAVYLVVLFHAGVTEFEGGFIGVDLFFVLSGYLVTSVMLTEYDASGRIDLVRFYARRIRRLLPAAVLAIVSIAVTSLFLDPPLTRSGFLGAARSALLYFSNWHFIGDKTDYFAADADRNPYLHFWSLSVEEQFYAAFPVLLIALLLVGGRRRSVVAGLMVVVTGILVGLQLFWHDRNPVRAYYGTDARTYQMAAGALLAVASTVWGVPRVSARRIPAALTVVLLAGLVVVATDVLDIDASARGFVAAAVSLSLIAALERVRGPVGWLLSRSTVVQLGRVSYGTYLWHWPIIVYARQVLDLGPVALAVFAGVAATAMAFLSYTLLEMPIRTAPQLAHRSPRVVTSGLLISGLVAVAVMPPIFNNDRKPVVNLARGEGLGVSVPQTPSAGPARLESMDPVATASASAAPQVHDTVVTSAIGPDAAGSSLRETTMPETTVAETPAALVAVLPGREDTIPPDIDLAQAAEYRITRVACTDGEPDECILERGDGPHVFVMGDSNAAMFIPMFRELAEEHGFTLSATTAGGCPWQEGLGWAVEDQTQFQECLRVRGDAYERVIPALRPDIIIGIHVPRDDPARGTSSPFFPLDESDGDGIDGIAAATRRSLDDLEALGARVIIIEPLPYTSADTLQCLSGAVYIMECAFEATVEPTPMEQMYREEDAAREGVSSVDLDLEFCPGKPVCSPIVEGELIFRDAYHLYPPYTVDHRNQVWELLEATGAFGT